MSKKEGAVRPLLILDTLNPLGSDAYRLSYLNIPVTCPQSAVLSVSTWSKNTLPPDALHSDIGSSLSSDVEDMEKMSSAPGMEEALG